jgi:hypothetical protein
VHADRDVTRHVGKSALEIGFAQLVEDGHIATSGFFFAP